jgi:hypothetical protein
LKTTQLTRDRFDLMRRRSGQVKSGSELRVVNVGGVSEDIIQGIDKARDAIESVNAVSETPGKDMGCWGPLMVRFVVNRGRVVFHSAFLI